MKIIKKLIKQYITCKHTKYVVIKTIFSGYHKNIPSFFEKRKCKECGRVYYSDYFVKINNQKEYFKYDEL